MKLQKKEKDRKEDIENNLKLLIKHYSFHYLLESCLDLELCAH